MIKSKNGRVKLSSKFVACGSKTSIFIEEQEASEMLSSVAIRTPLIKIPVLGEIFF